MSAGIPITCPVCFHEYDVLAGLSVKEHRQVVSAAFKSHELGRPILRYLGMFRPGRHRSVSASRLLHLCDELVQMLSVKEITYKARTMPTPPVVWQAAFAQLIEQVDSGTGPELPLTNHNYLKAIVVACSHETMVAVHDATARKRERKPINGAVVTENLDAPELSDEEKAFHMRALNRLHAELGGDDV